MNKNNNKNQITYLTRLFKKLDTLERKESKFPYYGKPECKQYDVPTVAVVFSNARDRGKVLYNSRLRKEEQERKLWARVEVTWQKYHHLKQFLNVMTPELIHYHARDIGNTIHDLPCRKTGYRSTNAILYDEHVKEHFHPRQWAGHQMMEYFLTETVTREGIYARFEVFRQVHETTQAENIRLRTFQESEKFIDWHSAYEEAGIFLILEEDNGPILTLEDIPPNL